MQWAVKMSPSPGLPPRGSAHSCRLVFMGWLILPPLGWSLQQRPQHPAAAGRRVGGTQSSEAWGVCVLTTEFGDTGMVAPEHFFEDVSGGQPLKPLSASGPPGGPCGATRAHDPRPMQLRGPHRPEGPGLNAHMRVPTFHHDEEQLCHREKSPGPPSKPVPTRPRSHSSALSCPGSPRQGRPPVGMASAWIP